MFYLRVNVADCCNKRIFHRLCTTHCFLLLQKYKVFVIAGGGVCLLCYTVIQTQGMTYV